MTSNSYTSWFGLGWDAWQLAVESSTVAGLRLARLAGGGSDATAEGRLMVTEKIGAAFELQAAAMTGQLGATALSGATKTVNHYRKKVAANRRRLANRR